MCQWLQYDKFSFTSQVTYPEFHNFLDSKNFKEAIYKSGIKPKFNNIFHSNRSLTKLVIFWEFFTNVWE